MNRRYVPFSPIFIIFVVIMIYCIFFGACHSNQPIRIGYLGSISGRVADIGIAGRDAVQLCVAQCNANGGIRGRQVRLIIKDDQEHVETAVKAVEELIEKDVAAIVGPMSSVVAMAIVPSLNASRVVAVGGTVTTPALSGLDDYFFRVCFTAREQANRSARYQIDSKTMRRIAVAYDGSNLTFCENWLESFKKPFIMGGGEILAVIDFNTEDGRSFSKIAHGLLAVEPDGILIIANPMDSAFLCQQIRKSNPSVEITLSNWAATERLIELGGKAVEGVTVPVAFDWNSPSQPYQTFRKNYIDRFKREPGFPGFYAYNAAQVVLTALNAQKRGQHLKASILSIGEFDGLQGKISFDAYGDVKPLNASIRIIRNQTFVVVE